MLSLEAEEREEPQEPQGDHTPQGREKERQKHSVREERKGLPWIAMYCCTQSEKDCHLLRSFYSETGTPGGRGRRLFKLCDGWLLCRLLLSLLLLCSFCSLLPLHCCGLQVCCLVLWSSWWLAAVLQV